MSTPRILFVLTSQHTLGDLAHPTGFWHEELSAPWWALRDAGFQVDLVRIGPKPAVADPASLTDDFRTAAVNRFLADTASTQALAEAPVLSDLPPADYAAVYLVGGHGAMWDFPANPSLQALLQHQLAHDGLIAAVCHGVAGLLNLGADLKGRILCGFSNEEEQMAGASAVVPFMLESVLREAGAHYQGAPAFHSNVVQDGLLITGQNPQSSAALGEALLKALSTRTA